MSLEVLVSCMNEKDMSIINKLNLKSDAVIINQCNYNSYMEKKWNKNRIKFFFSDQKGLTKSRNLALANATGDICIFCDDDVVYFNNYENIILKAFDDIPEADIIIFNIDRVNYDKYVKPIKRVRKAPRYKSYGSVRIAFKLDSLQQNNIWFNVSFGSGSIYSSGEESLLLREAHKKKLNIYEYPATIAKVDFSESTWREGYNEKFFYDKGALLAAAYPCMKYLFMFYYVHSLKKFTMLSTADIIKWLHNGMIGYKKLYSYNDFINKKNQ